MIFAITYDIKNVERASRLLSRISELGEYIQYLPNSVFLHKNYFTTASKIYTDLRMITNEEDRLLIVQVDKRKLMGWLNSNAVAWIREHN